MNRPAADDAAVLSLPTERELDLEGNWRLLRVMLWLALPVLAEHVLHIGVGITDTYIANHLIRTAGLSGQELDAARAANAAATAAVGTIGYVTWFIGLITGALGTGATALIARAVGARHRSLANGVCGQSITASIVAGAVLGAGMFVFADPLVRLAQLQAEAHDYAVAYLRLLSLAMPMTTLMFTAAACLRGAGDTVTPAIAMIVVDVFNIFFSFALTFGLWGFPKLGFHGIAAGTVIGYVGGGGLLFAALVLGRGGIRLYLHRMRPHWLTLKRVLRIGIPSGLEGLLQWLANFGALVVINSLNNVTAAAHINAIRIESFSYMSGFAFATAASTMVGQSLGMGAPRRAVRSAYLAFLAGGGLMTCVGLVFIFFGHWASDLMSNDPQVVRLTATCLFITGFIQCPFAAGMIFGGALRGAGDTLGVMLLNLASLLGIRLVGVVIVGRFLGLGLPAVWVVLCTDLLIRGVLMWGRFTKGKWKSLRV